VNFTLESIIVVHALMMFAFSALFAAISWRSDEWQMPWEFSAGYLLAPSVMVMTGVGMRLDLPMLSLIGLVSGFVGPALILLGGAKLINIATTPSRILFAFLAYAGTHFVFWASGFSMTAHLMVLDLALIVFSVILFQVARALPIEDHRLGRSLIEAVTMITIVVQLVRLILNLSDPHELVWQELAATMVVGATGIAAFGVAGVIIVIAERFAAQIRSEARTDSLTGLALRRVFDDHIEAEMERWRRYERPFSVVMFDIDYFKQVNDAHGHDVGDQALRLVARCGRAAVRPSDLIARIGGDEFGIVLPETSDTEAVEIAVRLLDAIRAAPLETQQGPLALTGSFGVASVRHTDEGVATVIKRADEALYSVKRRGRNGVAAYQPSPPRS
jgi:diguanylate cyclase (GGDEF)-like protein